MIRARAWIVWGAAVFAYLVAVMHRSSLGVAAVEATERFAISAAVMSSLAVVQLIVYAGLQVPVGVLLDRLGPRTLIASGALLMAVGQGAVAFADDFVLAVVGRILVGAGDACTFISVLRLLPNWFSGRLLPQVSQWTGNIGQLGQILSAVPFVWILHDRGWTLAYGLAAALGLAAFLIVLAIVRDSPTPVIRDGGETWAQTLRQAREALARPGTQLGFWSHFSTQAPGNTFTLLWGFPFLVTGLGYTPGEAAGLLSLFILAAIVSGPILGLLSARYPMRRSSLVLGIVALTTVVWLAIIVNPTPPAHWLIVTLVLVLGTGGPGSLIGFDYARTFNPARSQGSATGIVNVGGFVACFTCMFLIGLVLDLVTASGGSEVLYTWPAFRIAFASQFIVIAVGVVFILHARHRTRLRLREDEGITVAPLWVALSRALRQRGDHHR